MTDSHSELVGRLERANALCDLGRFEEAATILERVVSTNPAEPRAWCLLSLVRLNTGKYESALGAAGTAVSLSPESEWPWRLASAALRGLDRNDEAIAAARQAVSLAPNDWQAQASLARALLSGGQDLPAARAAAESSVALAPHSVEAHLTAGAVASSDGRGREAAAYYRQALALDPQSSAAHNELARLNLRKGGIYDSGQPESARLAEAAIGFAAAVRADPRAGVSRRNLDLTLRVFLSRAAYLFFIVAFVVARIGISHPGVARFAPLALIVPVPFISRFVRNLSPDLRKYLRSTLSVGAIRIAIILETVAALGLIASAFVPPYAVVAPLGVSMVCSLVGFVVLKGQRSRFARAARGLTDRKLYRTALMWTVPLVSAVAAVILVAQFTFSSSAELVSAAFGAGFLGFSAALLLMFVLLERPKSRDAKSSQL
jgi:tetratricopeptide (TPR) repeat protein